MADLTRTIEVKPLALHIGAEISGVDLGRPLDVATRKSINDALLRWKVVFFRGQHLDHRGHVAFARQMGEPTIGHAVFGHIEDFPEIYSVAKFRTAQTNRGARPQRPWTGWHTDITAALNPPKASILRGVTIPPYGGDTFWTNRFQAPTGAAKSQAYDESVRRRELETEHPIVRVHPETGERVLFVSPSFLKTIVGLTARESEVMLDLLWEHVVRPEYTVRFKWEAGDIAMWDNRATSHLAPTDIFDSDFDRQLYRITLVGDVPVGVDGRPSVAIKGEPILAVETELTAAAG
jgi:alpha-ketoglutarate-dependent taurine dioxygenase